MLLRYYRTVRIIVTSLRLSVVFFPIRPQSTNPLYKLCSDKLSVALIRTGRGVKLAYQLIKCKPSSPADRWFTSSTQLADHALMPPYLICSTLAARCRSLCKLLLQLSSTPAPPFGVSDSINITLSQLMPALLAFLLLHSAPQAFLVCEGRAALSAVPPLCFPRMHTEGLGARKTELCCQI